MTKRMLWLVMTVAVLLGLTIMWSLTQNSETPGQSNMSDINKRRSRTRCRTAAGR